PRACVRALGRRGTGEARGGRHVRPLARATGRAAGRTGPRRNDRGAESRRSTPDGPDAPDATPPDPRGDPCAQVTEAFLPPSRVHSVVTASAPWTRLWRVRDRADPPSRRRL